MYPFINQEQENDCAVACLAMLIKHYHKQSITLETLKKASNFQREYWSIKTLKQISSKYGVILKPYNADIKALQKLNYSQPLILYVKNSLSQTHFIIVYKKRANFYLIADPSKTKLKWISLKELEAIYLNICIITQKDQLFININKDLQPSIFCCLKPYLFSIILTLLINLFLTMITFLSSITIKFFIDNYHFITLENKIWQIILGFIIIIFTKIIISYFQNKIILTLTTNFTAFLTKKYYNAILENNLLTLEQHQDSDFLQRLEDLKIVCDLLTTTLLNTIYSFIMAIISSIWLCFIHWWFLIIVCFQNCLLLIINLIFHQLYSYQQIKHKNKSLQHYQQYLQLIQSSGHRLGCNLNQPVSESLQKSYIDLEKVSTNLNTLTIKNNHYEQLIINLINLLILILTSKLIINQQTSWGQVLFANTLITYITAFFQQQGQIIANFKKNNQAISRIKPLIFFNSPLKQQISFIKNLQTLTIKNLSFEYNAKLIFNNLNYSFKENTFLKGNSGVGKSTLLKLIANLYQNYNGVILLNNEQNIKSLTTNNFICYLQQNPYIYEGTILDNIVNFNYQLSNLKKLQKLKILEILQTANLDYNTLVSNNGSNLSRGQRQIIAFLAIFFHSQWKLILIDESLSNVNFQIKVKLISLLLNVFTDSLIIFVSHDHNLATYFPKQITLTFNKLKEI